MQSSASGDGPSANAEAWMTAPSGQLRELWSTSQEKRKELKRVLERVEAMVKQLPHRRARARSSCLLAVDICSLIKVSASISVKTAVEGD